MIEDTKTNQNLEFQNQLIILKIYTLCMYPNVTPDSPSNLCPQRIHISPKDPGCVHMSTLVVASAHHNTFKKIESTQISVRLNHSNPQMKEKHNLCLAQAQARSFLSPNKVSSHPQVRVVEC